MDLLLQKMDELLAAMPAKMASSSSSKDNEEWQPKISSKLTSMVDHFNKIGLNCKITFANENDETGMTIPNLTEFESVLESINPIGSKSESKLESKLDSQYNVKSFNVSNMRLIKRSEWRNISRSAWLNEFKVIRPLNNYQEYSYNEFIDRIYTFGQRLIDANNKSEKKNDDWDSIYTSVTKDDLLENLKVIYILLTETIATRTQLIGKLREYGNYLERLKSGQIRLLSESENEENIKFEQFELNNGMRGNGIGGKEFWFVFQSLFNDIDDTKKKEEENKQESKEENKDQDREDDVNVWDIESIVPLKVRKFLQLVLLQVSLHYRLHVQMRVVHRDVVNSRSINVNLNKLIDTFNSYYDLIPFYFVDKTGMSIFHICVAYDVPPFFGHLLKAVSNLDVFKDSRGVTPTVMAINYGRWEIFEKILFSQMGDKMKEKANLQRNKIEKQNGIIRQFLNRNKSNENEKENGSMNMLVNTIVDLIEKRLPISDDMLLLCWKYEIETVKDERKTRIWQTINKALNSILELPLKEHDWMWFKSYLFGSSLWFEKSWLLMDNKRKNKENDSKNLKEMKKNNIRSNESDELYCECGNAMEIVLPISVYSFGAKCNLCGESITPTTYFYHCVVGRNATHSKTRGGYDYCLSCANQRIKENKHDSENKQDTTVTTANIQERKNNLNDDSDVNDNNKNEQTSQVLYHKLVQISNTNLLTQKEFLKNEINRIFNDKNNEKQSHALWNIIDLKDWVISDSIRQDSIIDTNTNEQLLSHPNKPQFNETQLRQIEISLQGSNAESNMNIFHHYDANGYLSTLIVTANALNNEFHSTMCNVYDIEYRTMENRELKVSYSQGPIKRISRAQAKAETDYSGKPWPNTACITDFVRCSLCYDDCTSLLNGIETLKNVIAKGDTCLKKIVRIKNMFAANKRKFLKENKGADASKNLQWLYRYCDIKFNVIIENEHHSMVAEIQFLLDFMSKAKSLGHGLYEITRNEEFVNDMTRIFDLSKNKYQQLLFYVNSGVSSEMKTAQLLFGYKDEIDLFEMDKSGMAPIHYVCQNGLNKTLKVFLSIVSNDKSKLTRLINLKATATYGCTPLLYACRSGANDCIRTLLSYGELDVNARDQDGSSGVMIALEKGHSVTAALIRKDERYNEVSTTDPLLLAITTGSIDFLKDMLKDDNINFNVQSDDENGFSPIIAALSSNKKESKSIFYMLFNDARCDVTAKTKTGYNALIVACAKNDYELVKFLLDSKKYDVNYQADNGFNALMATLFEKANDDTIKILQLLLAQDTIDPTKPCQPRVDTGTNNELSGKTILDYCIVKSYEAGLKLLLSRKDVCQSGYVITEALVTAAQLGPRNVSNKKGKKGKKENEESKEEKENDETLSFAQMVYDGHKSCVKSIACDLGQALRASCFCGYVEMVKWLLTLNEIDVNATNGMGYTALMSASASGQLDIVKMLLNVKGIDYKHVANDKESMVSVAIDDSITNYLIEQQLLSQQDIIKLQDDAAKQRKGNQT